MGADTHSTPRLPPTLDVWIIVFNKKVDRQDFEICSRAVDKASVPKAHYLKGDVAWRYVVGALMPQYALRQRHVPRRDWSFMKTKVIEGSGKPYVHLKRDPHEAKNSRPALGFSWAEVGAVLAFAHSFGQKDVVINIGVGIHRKIPLVSVQAHILSKQHQLTKTEDEAVHSALRQHGEARALSRLHMILSIKDAYLRAMGQPAGFDLSRIECDVGAQIVTVDGESLSGWEFMVFDVDLGALTFSEDGKTIPTKPPTSQSQTQSQSTQTQGAGPSQPTGGNNTIPLVDREYVVAVAVFRGGKTLTIVTPPPDKDTGMIFHFTVGEIVANVTRLRDYDNAPSALAGAPGLVSLNPMPPVEMIPMGGVSAKSSVQSFETVTGPGGGAGLTTPTKRGPPHLHAQGPMDENKMALIKATAALGLHPHQEKHGHHPSQHNHSPSKDKEKEKQHYQPPQQQIIPVHSKGGGVIPVGVDYPKHHR